MIVAALIPAAGSGRRMGCGVEKQFLQLGGKPLLAHTLARFEATAAITRIVIIVPPGREKYCRQEIVQPAGFRKVSHIVAGAETRQRSVTEGFRCLSGDVDVVVVHDGARPFVTPTLIQAAIAAAARDGSAIVAIPESDTLKRVAADGTVVETLDRRYLWRAQTPQAFRREILRDALVHAERHHLDATDEAALVECLPHPVRIISGSTWNFKITSPDDLRLAELLLADDPSWRDPRPVTLECS
jgi:2-C-methyl-D-erythritol 4-phosphate cytidylyltransferase